MNISVIAKSVAAVLLFVALPFVLIDKIHQLRSEDAQSLLRLYLMTCAFVGALWAVYLREGRIRANSDNVLISLVVFVVATTLVALAVMCQLGVTSASAPSAAAAVRTWPQFSSIMLVLLSLEVYFVALLTLLATVFLKTYNQLYNLRTHKVIKYFKPIHKLRMALRPYKSYEFEMEHRVIDDPHSDLFGHFGNDDLERLKTGASVLITGAITDTSINRVMNWLKERLEAQETVNFVATDRPAIEIWSKAKKAGCEPHRDDFVIIDAYSPSFGFSDDIHENNKRKLSDQGVRCVTAKTFAGLHTATNVAFNLIKQTDGQKMSKNIRRPMVMVYAHVSALCDFESIEQFRVFWRHVIPSERSYGMLTIIIEAEAAGVEVVDFLRQNVDFVLKVEVGNTREDAQQMRLEKWT